MYTFYLTFLYIKSFHHHLFIYFQSLVKISKQLLSIELLASVFCFAISDFTALQLSFQALALHLLN